jgi:hypothetical protein
MHPSDMLRDIVFPCGFKTTTLHSTRESGVAHTMACSSMTLKVRDETKAFATMLQCPWFQVQFDVLASNF